MEHEQATSLILPATIGSRVDVSRLLREIESISDLLHQAALKKETSVPLPRVSRNFQETLSINKLNITLATDRTKLAQFLEKVHLEAPVLHMSFSADASPEFSARLVTWLRKEIHPLILIQTGLQPTIGAGCILRTTNKHFDFSLRQRFSEKREQLLYSLRGVLQEKVKEQSAVSPEKVTS